eukprot:TRINITY_DN9753_c0_g1_i1.p1 TRINITY_DN9753_c0_g1~~TRINITY_DN9753_c0_g1_i1.p1  ORF type:complete len:221 (-),score=28.85 TRINITY_DN9753_c0_g1_i1:279-941(-)
MHRCAGAAALAAAVALLSNAAACEATPCWAASRATATQDPRSKILVLRGGGKGQSGGGRQPWLQGKDVTTVPELTTEDPSRPWWRDRPAAESKEDGSVAALGAKTLYLAAAAPFILLMGRAGNNAPQKKAGSKSKGKASAQQAPKPAAAKPTATPAPAVKSSSRGSPSKGRGGASGTVTRRGAQLRAVVTLTAAATIVAGCRNLKVCKSRIAAARVTNLN